MSYYQVEPGIPVPTKRGRAAKYPWRDMKVGDSFFVPAQKAKPVSVSVSASAASRRLNRKFISRLISTEQGEPEGTRVWRIS